MDQNQLFEVLQVFICSSCSIIQLKLLQFYRQFGAKQLQSQIEFQVSFIFSMLFLWLTMLTKVEYLKNENAEKVRDMAEK